MGQTRRPRPDDPLALSLHLSVRANEAGPSERQLLVLDFVANHGRVPTDEMARRCHRRHPDHTAAVAGAERGAALRSLRHLERLGMVERLPGGWSATALGHQEADCWAAAFKPNMASTIPTTDRESCR